MALVVIILHNTHTTVWSSLSLRQFSEVTILPGTPQHWNCEFSLETLTFLWCFYPSQRLPPFEISLSMPKKGSFAIPGQGTAVRGSTDKVELHTACLYTEHVFLGLHIWALSTNYFLVQEISGFVEICFHTFLSISVICLDIWMSVLPLGFLSCSSWFTTSPSDLVSVFWIHRIYLPTLLQLPRYPDVTLA